MSAEDLWRATLHDFNNLLAGVQGVLDLSDPRLPLDARNRMRLETTLEDGKTLIHMARSLALGRHPDSGLAPWSEWRAALEARLESMAVLFRCPIELVGREADGTAWPTVLVEWAAAFTRQILPWAAPGPLRLEVAASPAAWTLTWLGDAPIPTAPPPGPPPERPRNRPPLGPRATAGGLDITLQETPGGLVARMARPCSS